MIINSTLRPVNAYCLFTQSLSPWGHSSPLYITFVFISTDARTRLRKRKKTQRYRLVYRLILILAMKVKIHVAMYVTTQFESTCTWLLILKRHMLKSVIKYKMCSDIYSVIPVILSQNYNERPTVTPPCYISSSSVLDDHQKVCFFVFFLWRRRQCNLNLMAFSIKEKYLRIPYNIQGQQLYWFLALRLLVMSAVVPTFQLSGCSLYAYAVNGKAATN